MISSKVFHPLVKNKFADDAVKSKDYVGLEHILKVIDYPGNVLNEAIDKLDVEATKHIVKAAKNLEYCVNGSYINEYHIENLLDNNFIPEYSFDEIEATAKRKEILKILLDAKNKDHISVSDLQTLANHVSMQEFEEFCKRKELDLKDQKFKDLELLQYKINGLEPVITIEDGEATILNLLLSRTYSDKLSLQELKTIYTKLYNLDPIAKEMLTYTAALISQGNSLKVLFAEGSDSFYSKDSNIIKVDNIFINEKIFNTESVLIHEIGHFVYQQIFNLDSAPFNMTSLKELIKDFYNEHKDAIEDPFMSATLTNSLLDKNKNITENIIATVKNALKPIMDYESAARTPMDKAAELLMFDKQEYAKYKFTEEYTEYFKHNSLIDLFLLNSYAFLEKSTHQKENKVPDHVFNNILKMYLSEQNICHYSTYGNVEVTKEDILKWASEEFLPRIVQELNLTPTQIHFLERIADYVNRGDHLLDDSYHGRGHANLDEEKYKELIVRCSEFKAAGFDEELTDTCKGLEAFHIATVSPGICEVISQTEVAIMPFEVGMAGETYSCLVN